MLTPNDDIVKKANSKLLRSAKSDDQRHRLHAEAATSAASASPYFKAWVKEFVEPVIPSAPKRDQLMKQFAWPPVTVELVDEIMDTTSAVHHAQDRFVKVDLSDAALEADCGEYLEQIKLRQFITRDCHNSLFSGPNSLVVVDLPAVQATPFPEPYVYLVSSDDVLAAKALTGGSAEAGLLEFAWFNTDKPNVTALFDRTEVALWEKKEGVDGWVEVDGSRAVHGLPFCPAFKMWPDVEKSNALTSNTILRPILGLLDRLMFWDGGAESNDLATAFLMRWYLETDPDQRQALQNIVSDCVPVGEYEGVPYSPLNPTGPAHANKKGQYGPGTDIPIPAQQSKEDADYRDPAGYIAPPVPNLQYIADKVVALRTRIHKTATGYEAPATKEAINEKQVLSIAERTRFILQYLAGHYETTEYRILYALCYYRYGPYLAGVSVNYGRRFTLLSGQELADLYKASKDAGLGFWLLEELDAQLQEYHAHTDASRKLRYKMLRDLNPYSFMTLPDMSQAGIAMSDPDGYAIAVCLPGFIRRFERENDLTIEEFGSAPDYNNRIQTILTRFKQYVSEHNPVELDPASGENESGSSNGKSGKKPVTGSTKRKSGE